MSRRPTGDVDRQREAVVYLLKARPHTERDFLAAGVREYRRRIRELRRLGYVIRCDRPSPKILRWRIVRSPGEKPPEQLALGGPGGLLECGE